MSDAQRRAADRMCVLCQENGGSCTIEHARQMISKEFALTPEDKRYSRSRKEPQWLIDLRNFVRDVNEDKYAYFEKIPEGVRLTEAGYEAIKHGRLYDVITPRHLDQGGEQLTMEM
jgi:hypothetical protein